MIPHVKLVIKYNFYKELAFKLQSLQWRAVSLNHCTASGVQQPTLTGKFAKQHFTTCVEVDRDDQIHIHIIF